MCLHGSEGAVQAGYYWRLGGGVVADEGVGGGGGALQGGFGKAKVHA